MRSLPRSVLPSDRRAALEAALEQANHRTALARQRDACNWRVAHPRDIAVGQAVEPEARAESQRLTRELGALPNIGRDVRRSFARRLAPAKVRPVYPLPAPAVTERKPGWGAREEARRVRQMAKGVRLSA